MWVGVAIYLFIGAIKTSQYGLLQHSGYAKTPIKIWCYITLMFLLGCFLWLPIQILERCNAISWFYRN